MPIYEFTCERCADRFEALCRMGSTGEDLECPVCGHPKVRKVMSTFASRSSSPGGGTTAHGSSCAGCSSGNCASCH